MDIAALQKLSELLGFETAIPIEGVADEYPMQVDMARRQRPRLKAMAGALGFEPRIT